MRISADKLRCLRSDDIFFLLKTEGQFGIPGKQKDEVKIETEDIFNNEHYNIYGTDEIETKKFLNPYMLQMLDEWTKFRTCVYVSCDSVYVSFYTNRLNKMYEFLCTVIDNEGRN